MLRDANNENWRDVQQADAKCCSPQHQQDAIFGVCDRNVECWLTADADYASVQTGRPAEDYRVDDPKTVFENAMGITSLDRKEARIADFTRGAPLRAWLNNRSFEDFYGQLRQKSKERNCQIENLRERSKDRE